MASASAADTRRALRELAAERNGSKKGGWLIWIVLLALLLALLFGGVGWALGWFTTPKQVAEFKALVDKEVTDLDKMSRGEKPFSESFDSMRPMFEKMRELPREVREEQMARLIEARSRAEANSYFAVPPQQRDAEMARRLKAEDDRRKQWMQRRQEGGQGGPPGGANRQASSQPNAGRGGPPGGGPPGGGRGGPGGGGGGPPGGGRRGGTEDSSNARRLAGINRTSPDDRARQTEYRRLRDEARARSGGGGGGR